MLRLTLLPEPIALCRLAPESAVPAWAWTSRQFLCITRTASELSIVADESAMPADVEATRAYRAFRVEGPMALDLVGIIASLAGPLAEARVPIFPIATYDTDYLLVASAHVQQANDVLVREGHRIVE
jgi:hypothetical protein